MRNLIPISGQHIERFRDIANAKRDRKQRLLAVEGTVNSRYTEYEQATDDTSDLSTITQSNLAECVKDDLLHCYTSETVPLGKLKADIRKIQPVKTCQYCGIGEATTFDHYLPKEMFPEFCVLPINLIPCCSLCNSKKGDRLKDSQGKRMFINFYYDRLPTNVIYLYASLHYDVGVQNGNTPYELPIPLVNYQLRLGDNSYIPLHDTISHHYSRLDLINRYREMSNDVISEKFYEIRYKENVSHEEISNELRITATSLRRQYGMNYWKAALIDALANSKQFIEYCVEENTSDKII